MSLSPKKLLLSKWTSTAPARREKHFLVTSVIVPDDGSPVAEVDLQAVLTERTYRIGWRELNDQTRWVAGWK